jgi:integrase
MAFDDWRVQKAGRRLTQSTIKSHNAALQRVFDEAVIHKWMQSAQIPDLSATSGTPATRRDYFTPQEVRTISDAFPAWIEDSVTQRSKDIRQLLYYYFHVAVYTGMRPGTEMDNLRWSDLIIRQKDESIPHILITVRKGKTTLHTGTRVVMPTETALELRECLLTVCGCNGYAAIAVIQVYSPVVYSWVPTYPINLSLGLSGPAH